MIIAGIDPSLTNTGYCILDTEKVGVASILEIGTISTPENMVEILRYNYISKNIEKLLKEYKIEQVGSESPIFGAAQSENLFALYSFIKNTFYRLRVDVVYFSPMQLKMLAKKDPEDKTQLSSLGKQEMIDAMVKDLNLPKATIQDKRISSDMADAFHVAHFAARFWQYYGETITDTELTPSETKAFIFEKIFKRGLKAGKKSPKQRGICHKQNQLYYLFSDLKTLPRAKGEFNRIMNT